MLIAEMNIEIKGVPEWLTINKLSLNIDKTHFMLFKTRNESIELKGDLIIKKQISLGFVSIVHCYGEIISIILKGK